MIKTKELSILTGLHTSRIIQLIPDMPKEYVRKIPGKGGMIWEFDKKVIEWIKRKPFEKTYKLEKTAQDKILKYLNAQPGMSFDKIQTGFYGKTRGISDLVGVYNGRAVFIEVKSEIGRPTQNQINFLRRKKEVGALAGVARSIHDAINICSGAFGLEFRDKGWCKE